MTKQCVVCGSQLASKRSDAKFCSDTCRSKSNYNKKKKQSEDSPQESLNENMAEQSIITTAVGINNELLTGVLNALYKPIEDAKAIVKIYREKLNKIEIKSDGFNKKKLKNIEYERLIPLTESAINNKEILLSYDDEKLYNHYISKYREKFIDKEDPRFIYGYTSSILLKFDQKLQLEIKKWRLQRRMEINTLKIKVRRMREEQNALFGRHNSFEEYLEHYENKKKLIHKRINELEDRITEPVNEKIQKQLLDGIFSIKNNIPIIKPTKKKDGLTAPEILGMKTTPIDLTKSELSNFLGDLDRKSCSIALTGDSGAGKSFFSYDLALLFDQSGFKCIYYSLEEGVGELTKNKIIGKNFSNNFIITDTGKLSDIRKSAKIFDVIFIDSFGKIGAKIDDYEKLRQDFPNTIFISIFQKTTTGSIRGGSSITFDSSAVIDVTRDGDDRTAVMKKSRYGTQDWEYSITDKCLITD